MPHNARRPKLALIAAVGGALAALSLSSATASADEWEISGSGSNVLSVTGIAPWYQTVIETGSFNANDITPGATGLTGIGSNDALLTTTYAFGMTNLELVNNDGSNLHDVVDVMNFGNGFINSYIDIVGSGPDGTNLITDTLTTPFGNIDIPTTFDASLLFDPPSTAAATDLTSLLDPSAFATALEADWASLVALF